MEDHLPCAGTGEEYEKEAVAKMCDEITTTHIPHPSLLFWGERCKLMSEAAWEKGAVRERCFKICVYFSLSYSDLVVNKVISQN